LLYSWVLILFLGVLENSLPFLDLALKLNTKQLQMLQLKLWVHTLLEELSLMKHCAAALWCDNLGATYVLVNLVFHARTKHVEIGFHFVRERVAMKQLVIRLISIGDQIVDGFTKAMSVQKLKKF
jgi:hypothetical protein